MAGLYPYQQELLKHMTQYKGRGLVQLTGRNAGKSHISSYINLWNSVMGMYQPKIKWQRLPGLKLQAYTDDIGPRGFERGLNESDMDPVQAWSVECNCGTRTSFNIWQFKSDKQITMFLLKWSS